VVTAINPGTVDTIVFSVTDPCNRLTTNATKPIVIDSSITQTITGVSQIYVGTSETLKVAPGGGTWTSSATGIASVNPTTGAVTGIAKGSATIDYSLSGCSATYPITVGPIAPIAESQYTCVNCTTCKIKSKTPGGVWRSQNPAVTEIDKTSGILKPKKPGKCDIYYRIDQDSVKREQIIGKVLKEITGPSSFVVGQKDTLREEFTSGTGISGEWWRSSDFSKASVDHWGVVSGVAPGSVQITVFYDGCEATKTITVTAK
jgi:uncharacterized protein YjdB